MSTVAAKLEEVGKKLTAAAHKSGRQPESIKLVAVTKTVGVPRIIEALEAGVLNIGENRIQEAKLKHPELISHKVVWHMIGHLQTNKVRDAVKMFDVIHSVDSLRLAVEINKEASKNSKVISCLIEINSGSEISKYGMQFEEVSTFLRSTIDLEHIRFEGLMTVAPIMENPEYVRPFFRKMKVLFEQIKAMQESISPNIVFNQLSMGMSQDYETAIEEGATMVRIGSAIFGNR